ncbi:related to Cell division control protein 18 [Ustilago sp. UG-2017a]|nr:related to Cell division control protein 18 [Ustilago sp. UG-2017a]
MPLTRAISARLRSGSQRKSLPTAADHQTEEVIALKAKAKTSASIDVSVVCRTLVAGTLAQLNLQDSSKGSSPLSSTSASTAWTASRPQYMRGSGRFSSRSSNSSRRSILGSSEFGDSSDDENDNGGNTPRLGGCDSFSPATARPDDSNKENVAPFRCASQDVLHIEARDAQQEEAIRRTTTRSRRSSLMERQSFTAPSPTTHMRRLSRSSTTSDLSTTSALTMPRTPSRRLARSSSDQHHFSSSPSARTTSETTPTRRPSTLSASGRKRSRNDVDFDAEDASLPASPLSRLRFQTPSTRQTTSHLPDSPSRSRFAANLIPDHDSSCYLAASSQESLQSSLFDTHSMAESSSAPTSSCSSDRDVSPPLNAAMLESAGKEKYSSVYAHARALLRYAAGVDPAETEAGLTITNAAVTKLGGHHVKVVGREHERTAIQLFLQHTFGLFADAQQRARSLNVELDGDAEASCLYVCGLPGTGKTALVRSVLNSLSETNCSSSAPRVAFVNCMTLSHPRLIFGKVLRALGSNAAEGQSDAFAEQALSTLIRQGNQRILIVLDEMDHLLQSRAHQNILYKIFSWTANGSGVGSSLRGGPACGLIGIANSLDLTERFVPLLASKDASPALLHFRPFEAEEIVSVIRDRLSGLQARYDDQEPEAEEAKDESLALFTPTALQLLAKKIAGATGDLRKALDAARLAVELVESEHRKKALAQIQADKAKAKAAPACQGQDAVTTEKSEQVDAEQPLKTAALRATPLGHLTRSSAPKVGPSEILKVLTSVLGSPNLSKVRSLGVQAKLVLLSILIAQARAEHGLSVLGSATSQNSASSGSTAACSATRIADVELTYHAILKQENGLFSPLQASELLGVFDMLEVNGVVRISSEVDNSFLCATRASAVFVSSSSVSPSGKRAAKKQLMASSKQVYLAMSADDVQRGICTCSPGSSTSVSTGTVTAGGVAVAETIARIYAREKDRAVKAKTYHSIAQENARIRQEELGGGRMGAPDGSF